MFLPTSVLTRYTQDTQDTGLVIDNEQIIIGNILLCDLDYKLLYFNI